MIDSIDDTSGDEPVVPVKPRGMVVPFLKSLAGGKIDVKVAAPQEPVVHANMASALRELADQIDGGEREDHDSFILIGCGSDYTASPVLLGQDMSATCLLGKIVMAKALLMDWMKDTRR